MQALTSDIRSVAKQKANMPDMLNGECHTVFTTVENAHKLLLDDQGRFIPTEDICKVCR